MSVGAWNVNVKIGMFPQKVATALNNLSENFMGANYNPIAYLGSQTVNGTNHAVLAEQEIISQKNGKNIVVLIFNEKGMDCNLINIERVVEGGAPLGGTQVDVKISIPDEAWKAYDSVLGDFVGAAARPFALLATQVTKGTNYIFAAEISPIADEDVASDHVAIIVVNSLTKTSSFTDLLKSGMEVALGCPLGELNFSSRSM